MRPISVISVISVRELYDSIPEAARAQRRTRLVRSVFISSICAMQRNLARCRLVPNLVETCNEWALYVNFHLPLGMRIGD